MSSPREAGAEMLTWIVIVLFLNVAAALALMLSRSVERFIGWRYLYRRRHSRLVLWLTLVSGLIAAAAFAAFTMRSGHAGATAGDAVVQLALVSLTAAASTTFAFCLFLNFFSVFTAISIAGVFLGVRALIVVLSVTSGFQEEFQAKVLGVNAHVLVLKYGLDFSEYRDVMKKAAALPHVKAVAPFVFHEMMIAHGPQLSGVIVKGIQPGISTRVLDLPKWMVTGTVDTLSRSAPAEGGGPPLPGILVGKELARKLKVKIGDRVRVVSPLGDLDPSMWTAEGKTPKAREFRVSGIFYSGFDEYDRRLVCIELKEAQAFLEGGDVVTGVEMTLDDIYKSGDVANDLDKALNGSPYRVMDWRELNHNLFTALKLQKMALAIILTIIVLVAAFGIIATLTMLVIDKTREIAILKSVGMRNWALGRIFQTAGLTIGMLGTLAGIGLGLIDCFLASRYQYHLDPRVYLIDRLPVKVDPVEIGLTVVITFALCFFFTLIPARRAARLHPVEGLRYE